MIILGFTMTIIINQKSTYLKEYQETGDKTQSY